MTFPNTSVLQLISIHKRWHVSGEGNLADGNNIADFIISLSDSAPAQLDMALNANLGFGAKFYTLTPEHNTNKQS